MAHLREEQLIDLAEGTRPEQAEPHLASCERCRRELAELRSVLSAASAVEVPEPSPLFWDHLSARVRQAVADDAPEATVSRRPWGFGGWRVLVPAASLAALVLASAIVLRPVYEPVDDGRASTESAPDAGAGAPVDVAALFDVDPSLQLLADLAGEVDFDEAMQAGLATGAGSVDRVVLEMSAGERLMLQQILREEMARPGA